MLEELNILNNFKVKGSDLNYKSFYQVKNF